MPSQGFHAFRIECEEIIFNKHPGNAFSQKLEKPETSDCALILAHKNFCRGSSDLRHFGHGSAHLITFGAFLKCKDVFKSEQTAAHSKSILSGNRVGQSCSVQIKTSKVRFDMAKFPRPGIG
jgi:hypothetical protein